MQPFTLERTTDPDAAVQAITENLEAKFIGGGTNLVDLMKEGVEAPSHLIDINRLPLIGVESLPDTGGVRIGAIARNSHVANDRLIRERYTMLSEAFLAGASPQLRNMATVGGNLLQRTRCFYFTDPTFPCNKRIPGSGCPAIEGFNRIHAILGTSDHCIATHPSDMCVALAALDAIMRIKGANGERVIPINDFYRLPGETPHLETVLEHGELITAVDLPPIPFAKNSHYLKLRDRTSYAFALVSVAVALDITNGIIRQARLALGGVAPKPWRAISAEAVLVGSRATEATFTQAAAATVRDARPYEYNAFKVEMAQHAIVRALTTVTERITE